MREEKSRTERFIDRMDKPVMTFRVIMAILSFLLFIVFIVLCIYYVTVLIKSY